MKVCNWLFMKTCQAEPWSQHFSSVANFQVQNRSNHLLIPLDFHHTIFTPHRRPVNNDYMVGLNEGFVSSMSKRYKSLYVYSGRIIMIESKRPSEFISHFNWTPSNSSTSVVTQGSESPFSPIHNRFTLSLCDSKYRKAIITHQNKLLSGTFLRRPNTHVVLGHSLKPKFARSLQNLMWHAICGCLSPNMIFSI